MKNQILTRRQMLFSSGVAMVGLSMIGMPGTRVAQAANDPLAMATTFGHDLVPNPIGAVEKTEEEWKKLLSADAFAVLRKHGTEYPFTSPLNDEKRAGTYSCAGCDLPLYRSETKFDSGTGWPSFYEAIKSTVGTESDFKLFYTRTEVHCIRCKGHQGHIFSDGPEPTGNRHCINGVSLKFTADAAQSG